MRLLTLCSRVSSVLAVFGLAASAVAQTPAPRTFSNYYFFGDSLTDSGNTFALTGSPPAPYFQGRVSNGITFAEYLAPGLANAVTTSANAPRLNFAYAGATASTGSAVPNLGQQVAQYQARGITASANGLYVLLAGANDLLNAIQVPANQSSTAMNATGVTASTAVTSAVSSLAGLGAKNILVLNLPDISKTPRFTTGSGASGALFMQTGVLTYNRDIATRLAGLSVAPDVRVTLVDLGAVFNQIVANPQRFGFTIANQEYVGVLQSGANPGDVNNYIFWDGIHPTTKTHALFAQVLTEVVNPEFVLGTASAQGTALLAASDLAADALASRLDAVRGSGVKREGAHGWVSYSDKDGAFDATGYQNAFDLSTNVTAAGFDASIGHDLVAGLAVSKDSVSAQLAAGAGSFKLEGQSVAAYVQWKSGNVFADASASFGSQDVRTIARRTLLGGLMTSAKTKGDRWGAAARVGLDLGGDLFHLTPFAGLRYTKGSLDGYTETGVSGLNFAYDEQTAKQVDGLIGATADWQVTGGSIPVYLGVSAVFQKDLADDTRVLTGRLADTVAARNSASITDGLDQSIKLGARVGGVMSKRWGWTLGYTAELRDNGDQANLYSISLQTGF
jgi:outer membrane lipase/esterase